MTALEKHPDRFSRTRAVLDTVVDTHTSFALRKIAWAKAECLQGKVVAKRGAFREYALIKQFWHIPEVKEAFEQALAELQRRTCD
jgi:hypothetical protein